MIELSRMLEDYRNKKREFPTYEELTHLLGEQTKAEFGAALCGVSIHPSCVTVTRPIAPKALLPIFQSAEQNEQLARDAQATVDADVAALAGKPEGWDAANTLAASLHRPAAAPQVVADERAYAQNLELVISRLETVSQNDTDTPRTLADEALVCARALQAAPMQAQEPFAYMIVDDSGEAYFSEFCVASGKTDLEAELEGLNYGQEGEPYKIVPIFRAPVQPVAVPDGWKLVPVEPTERMICAGIEAYHGKCEKSYAAMLNVAPAAPAAQVDAPKSSASFSDHIRWVIAGVRKGHGVDDAAINNMRAWHERKIKESTASLADKKSIRYDFLRLNSEQYYVAFRDQFGAFRQIREKELDKTIDAAIAAKAAS